MKYKAMVYEVFMTWVGLGIIPNKVKVESEIKTQERKNCNHIVSSLSLLSTLH